MSQPPQGRKLGLIAGGVGLLVAIALIFFLVGRSSGSATTAPASSVAGSVTRTSAVASATTRAATSASTITSAPATGANVGKSGLVVVKAASLPPEARTTLALVASGGPFPYSRDGVVYKNLEKILPRQTSGYYHEFTVVTPGSKDRGARRIIAGSKGERFYTDDHYASFKEVVG